GLDITSYATLTGMINEVKSPRQFLKRFLFSNHVTLHTEEIEITAKVGNREVAPFVRKNGQSIMVGGRSEKGYYVAAPNIRINRPLEPSTALCARTLQDPIYPNRGAMAAAVRRKIAEIVQ